MGQRGLESTYVLASPASNDTSSDGAAVTDDRRDRRGVSGESFALFENSRVKVLRRVREEVHALATSPCERLATIHTLLCAHRHQANGIDAADPVKSDGSTCFSEQRFALLSGRDDFARCFHGSHTFREVCRFG